MNETPVQSVEKEDIICLNAQLSLLRSNPDFKTSGPPPGAGDDDDESLLGR
jgi:hypothetical protein